VPLLIRPTHMTSRPVHLFIPLLLGAVAVLVWAAPASASCAGTPRSSPARFTGTVTAVGHNGRVATVRTNDGRTVQVVGTPDLAAQATSVDRTFTIGARYEFHPTNDSPPYQDNACTATHQIAADTAPGIPGWVVPTSVTAAVILAAVGTVAARWTLRRRRRPVPRS